MRGKYTSDNLTGNVPSTSVEFPSGSIVNYDEATGEVTLAFAETQNLFVAEGPGLPGKPVTIRSWKSLNRTFLCTVTETCARGTDLYLDVQADLASATGKLKVTAGTATVVLFKADDVVAVADSGKVPVISEKHFD